MRPTAVPAQIDIQDLPAGLYFMLIQYEDKQQVILLMKL